MELATTNKLPATSSQLARMEPNDIRETILSSRKDARVKTLNSEFLSEKVLELINLTYFELKYAQPDDSEIVLTAQLLTSDIGRFHPTMTIGEIKLAFKLGSIGHYGEFQGLSVATFNRWIFCLTQSKERADVIKHERSLLHKEPPPPTDAEVRELSIKATIKCFETYKASGHIVDFGNAIFKFLEAEKLLNLTIKRKNEILQQVRERLEFNIQNNLRNEPEKYKRAELAKRLETIIVNPKAGELIYEARAESLRQYFKSLIDLEQHVKDYLQEKVNL